MKLKLSAIVSFAAFAALVAFAMPIAAQEAHPPHWSYSGEGNPKEWGKLDSTFSACSIGGHQSPIDIETKHLKPTDLPALEFNYNAAPLSIIDNGHTVMVNYAPGSTLTVAGHVYTLKQFHFHHPSEEKINGKTHPMVAHLVHSDADGHLAVVAVLFEQGAGNAEIDTIWGNIPKEKEKTVDSSSVMINAKDLLPSDHSYFTFTGSLTTPPCTEGVTWYVLRTGAHVSKAQIDAFAKLYPHNARPVQALNGREIQESK